MEQGLPPPLAAQDSWGVGIIKEFMAEAAPSLSSVQGRQWVEGDGQGWHSTWGHCWQVGTWNSLPGKAEPPLELPEPQFCKRNRNICILEYLVAKWPVWPAAPIPFSPEMEWGVLRKSDPKTHKSQDLWEPSLPLCCARMACGCWENFLIFF